MKTAISVPDDVFRQADDLARRMKKSRSEIYSRAVREYVARYSEDEVTGALDAVYEDPGRPDEFAREAARRALQDVDW
jgi:metal-responsive CopG/Arc/MetJ family transcriptional regulator